MNNFEINILNWIRKITFFDPLFKVITFLGGQEFLILIVIIIYFIISKKKSQRIAFSIFTSLLLNNSLKAVIDRVRPFNNPNRKYSLDDSITGGATGQSFPSGHSQNSSVTYSSIALTFKNKTLNIVAIFTIAFVGISRIVLGVHYPSDVVVGIILGLIIAYFGLKLHLKYEDDFKKQITLYIVVAIIFLPFSFFFINKVKLNYIAYKDLYTTYAFYIGFIGAVIIEKKWVDFNESNPLKLRIIRAIIAIIIVIIIQFGLKLIFPENNIYFDMFRYFLLSFISLGIYPLLFKNLLFSKAEF